ncbi:NAD-dependent aldehyde dehydrogenase [Staphylotrichum tortipilum]|uniref:NAD-dependent aldehyde dehydrogenase n=1 Tax=Staphylotrichum tortipilum TaxID=2831512 RepID=A0AAN6MB73_9PEZI|nr:NAD-dependent aldehyde dehydrogenase [Staphylotrichum longicolle]
MQAEADAIWGCDTLAKAAAHIRARAAPMILPNFVGGEFTLPPSSAATSGLVSYEPKTGELLYQLPRAQHEDVEAAVGYARAAFPSWSRTTRAERSRLLRRVSELLGEHRELFAVWESINQGKTVERARVEVDRAIANFAYFSTYILHEDTKARMVDSGVLTYEHRSPAGVFALISPWNMPLYLLTWKIAPCLAFGCTAVAKPSEITSMTAYLLGILFRKAGLPPGVINIIFGDGATTGAALVASPGIDGVSFTGGTQTGIAIRRATAHQIGKHLSLELGGKNATLVFADAMGPATRERTIKTAATAAFENQGEVCLCGSRIYVERAVYEEFVREFSVYVAKNFAVGKTVGAIASVQHYNKITGYLELAAKENAQFHLGTVPARISGSGANPGGYWISPTILTDVAEDSAVQKDEIFGPVVTITPFDGEEEAVRLANDSQYGLAAVLLTADGARMRRVGEQLQAGLVWVNCWLHPPSSSLSPYPWPAFLPSPADSTPGSIDMHVGPAFFRRVTPSCYSPAARLVEMDAAGVDVQVLSTVPVLFCYDAPLRGAVVLARALNDHLIGVCGEGQGRFVGLVTVPLQDCGEAVKELRRVVGREGVVGVQIGTSVEGTGFGGLDGEGLEEFWGVCEELDVPVFVHPLGYALGRENGERWGRYWSSWLVGMPCETALAMHALMSSGVLVRHPRLRVCFAHGGGAFPALLGRIQHGFDCRPDLVAMKACGVTPTEHFSGEAPGVEPGVGQIWIDSLMHDPDLMEFVIRKLGPGGASRIVLGSDYPFPLGEVPVAGKMLTEDERLGRFMSWRDKAGVLAWNAIRFLKLGREFEERYEERLRQFEAATGLLRGQHDPSEYGFHSRSGGQHWAKWMVALEPRTRLTETMMVQRSTLTRVWVAVTMRSRVMANEILLQQAARMEKKPAT